MTTGASVQYAVHDANGKILRTGSAPPQYVAMQARAGETAVVCDAGVSDARHYVCECEFVEQQPLIATWDTQVINGTEEEATLSGLPIPCTVYVDGTPVEVLDGSFEFSAEVPGDYRIRVDETMFLTKDWIIDAN